MRMKTFGVAHRRRREGRTDYRQRLRLLKARKPRLVIRRSSGGVSCQVVEYRSEGDRVIASAGPNDIKSKGWKVSTGNVPAAYLVGLACGVEARKKKVKEAVPDIGLHVSTKGSRIYACLKGFSDAGIAVPHSEEVLPDEERVRGSHIEAFAAKLKAENASMYSKQFSGYLKAKLRPEAVSKHFEETRKKLVKSKTLS